MSGAEMACAGGIGAKVWPLAIAEEEAASPASTSKAAPLEEVLLFSESNTRFVCEVAPEKVESFLAAIGDAPCSLIGETTPAPELKIAAGGAKPGSSGDLSYTTIPLAQLKESWQAPLRW